jgi:HEAT repeat protein
LATAEKPAKTGQRQVYDRLNELVLENTIRLAKSQGKNYHPATRFNAALMIGELKAPEAVPALLDLVKNRNLPQAVRVAAMVGLIHHAGPSLGINDAQMIREVTATMVAIAKTPVPGGEQAGGGNWLRGQAAEVLGLLGSVGENGAAAKALGKMVSEGNLPLAERCQAADALGQLDYNGASLPVAAYLKALKGLARDALKAESNTPPNARRLKSFLEDVLTAVRGAGGQQTGIGGLAKGADGQQRDKLVNVLRPLCQKLGDAKLPPEELGSMVDEAMKALE